MTYNEYFKSMLPFWNCLKESEKDSLISGSSEMSFKKGEPVSSPGDECRGVIMLLKGQLRVYIMSEDGREITLYRIKSGEVCVLSASCVLDAIVFDVFIEAADESRAVIIPLSVFRPIMLSNKDAELFVYKESVSRFSDVMWTMQQILFIGADKRLARFLLDETHGGKSTVYMTHDEIARNIGSAREVVSRLLKYMSREGIVSLSRGKITITDRQKVKAAAGLC